MISREARQRMALVFCGLLLLALLSSLLAPARRFPDGSVQIGFIWLGALLSIPSAWGILLPVPWGAAAVSGLVLAARRKTAMRMPLFACAVFSFLAFLFNTAAIVMFQTAAPYQLFRTAIADGGMLSVGPYLSAALYLLTGGAVVFLLITMPKTLSKASVPVPEGGVLSLTGPYAGVRFPLPQGEVLTIGIDPAVCNLVLEGIPQISRRHCTIRFEAGIYLVTDTSGEGTYLSDGARLGENQSVKLPPGTKFYAGSADNSFLLE